MANGKRCGRNVVNSKVGYISIQSDANYTVNQIRRAQNLKWIFNEPQSHSFIGIDKMSASFDR
jgi:hypothetical protein